MTIIGIDKTVMGYGLIREGQNQLKELGVKLVELDWNKGPLLSYKLED